MPSVFHYTNAAGFVGITQSKALWATDYRFLNDSSEGRIMQSLLVPIFEKEIAPIYKVLTEQKVLEGYYETHGTSGHRQEAESIFGALVRTVDNISPTFVASFCRHSTGNEAYEHGLLSQWRGYGDTGGIAIEFDENQLDELLKAESGKYVYAGWRSDAVSYGNYERFFKPEDYKGFAAEQIRSMAETRGVDISRITGKADTDAIAQKYLLTAPFLKHSGFRQEEEYRIALPRIARHNINPKAGMTEKPIRFRGRDGLLIPYIELFGEVQGTLPILAVIVGPHPMQDQQVAAVRTALESSPFSKAKVRKSAIPYRR